MQKGNSMEILNYRLIAFLDVLGFSKMLFENSLESLHGNYSNFISQAKNTTFFPNPNDPQKRTNFEFGKFISDSIILVSNPIDDIYNINNFIMAITNLLGLGFKNNFPIRGVIGIGDIIIDEENGIVLSKELPELLKQEKQQDWAGCILLEDAEKIVLESIGGSDYGTKIKNNPLQNDLIHSYFVPTKNGKKNSFALNFSFFMNDNQKNKGLEYLIEPKKQNVKDYFSYLEKLPIDKDVLPANMRIIKTRTGFSFISIES